MKKRSFFQLKCIVDLLSQMFIALEVIVMQARIRPQVMQFLAVRTQNGRKKMKEIVGLVGFVVSCVTCLSHCFSDDYLWLHDHFQGFGLLSTLNTEMLNFYERHLIYY